MKHIGIVACSAEGAGLCYRTICVEGGHPEVSLHAMPLADYVACLERSDMRGVAELMLTSARKLAAAGAELLICPDNTIHRAMAEVLPRSPLPWLHIADVVADEAVRRGFRQVGLLGTRWLVDSSVYPDRLDAHGVPWRRPSPADRDVIHSVIMDELVRGIFRQEAFAEVRRVAEGLRDAGCDAVILGCTELPLILSDENAPLLTLDSTRLLARAALNRGRQTQGEQG